MLSPRVFLSIAVLTICARAHAVPALNLPHALADTKSRLSAGQQANILVLGDSFSLRDGSYLPFFRNQLQQQFGNAGAGYQGLSLWTGGGFSAGWTTGIVNQDVPPHLGMDGFWATSQTAGSNVWFQAQNRTIELHYLAQPGGGRFQPFDPTNPNFPLGAAIDTNSAVTEVRTWRHTLPAGAASTIGYRTLDNASVTLLGQNNVTDSPGVRVHRAANGGYTVAHFLQRHSSFDQQLKLLAPDLVMVLLGANDAGGTSAERFSRNLNRLIDRIDADMPSAEVVLVTPYDISSVDGAADHVFERVVAPEEQIAIQRDLGYINLHEVAGDYDSLIAQGYLDDGVHLSPAGGRYISELLFDAFITEGRGRLWGGNGVDALDYRLGEVLVPEPASALLASAALLMLRRRRAPQ